MSARPVPAFPATLPKPTLRARRGGPVLDELRVTVRTTTEVLGGGVVSRDVDREDVFRVPSLRGQLRLWWRALQTDPALLASSKIFAYEEARLWGAAAAANSTNARSQVEISVDVPNQQRNKLGGMTLGAHPADRATSYYVLWPARADDKHPRPAKRYKPGIEATIRLRGPRDDIAMLRNVLRAWILFGGYGARTRRGLGSLTVLGDEAERSRWLPAIHPRAKVGPGLQLRMALTTLFGRDIFAARRIAGRSVPLLAGAACVVDTICDDATCAWTRAVGFLRDFRQGDGIARPARIGKTPGSSRWPEPDKIRHLADRWEARHKPRYDDIVVWPRAAFGLPIGGRFNTKTSPGDPGDFMLTWEDGVRPDGKPIARDRLASPLIVKALPVIGGYLPCLLWLNRADPGDPARVVLALNGTPVYKSRARFVQRLSAHDIGKARALAAPWPGDKTMRSAFIGHVITMIDKANPPPARAPGRFSQVAP